MFLKFVYTRNTHEEIHLQSAKLSRPRLEILAPHLLRENALQNTHRVLGEESVFTNPEHSVENSPVQPPVDNFYKTYPITRASKTMAKCTHVKKSSNFL